MSNERTPLVPSGVCGLAVACGVELEATTDPSKDPRKLNTFFGVMVPTILSMFSIVLFLRTGFVVGHAGLLQGLLMVVVAYTIISLTILSICAISTNGAIQGGGAYYMISRSLGPEFGGSIGLMFFLAKVFACGEYVLGLVEALLDVFGSDPESSVSEGMRVLPQGYWYSVLYSSVVLLLCLLVCLVGAHIYSRTAFVILLVVTVTLLSIFVSSVVVIPRDFVLVHKGSDNQTARYNASYTGFNATTLRNNLGWELKTPSVSIPKGTIVAVFYTFTVYVLLFILVSATCDRTLLIQDYGFLQRINIWSPFVTVGIFCAALSAAMCAMIGASRILHALALDQLFGTFAISPSDNYVELGESVGGCAVHLGFGTGQLNAVAGLVTVFYLLAYAAVDLACLALEWASAPNFRPTFQLFSWHTCLLGILSCLVMMFVINPVYSSGSIVLLLVLLLFLHYRSPTSSWGYVSQALIFHQVRKYLLMLDVRKDHVKFWRPQMLLMVANPRSSCQLILFVNQLKKGGLYVLGHVQLGDLDSLPTDPVQQQYNFWLSLVDKLGVKAFVDLTLSPSVRQGTQHLLRITGLGGMKPNTLILGFYDGCTPEDFFLQDSAFCDSSLGQGSEGEYNFGVDLPSLQAHFPPVRHVENPRWLSPEEYVGIISDAVKMNKNVCLARYFFQLEGEGKDSKVDGSERTIDVWPLNLLQPGSRDYEDVCSLFLLQMACVLNMSNKWRHARMRIFLNVETESSDQGWVAIEETFRELLRKLRIRASIKIVPWDSVVQHHVPPSGGEPQAEPALSEAFLSAVNSLLMEHSAQAAVRFLYLPRPGARRGAAQQYLAQVEAVTNSLGPTLLIHGVTPVTYTDL
ncbi:Solute carrier family 12 member 9 [Liparis tanakae]|uniref:Solute carrier family 12 member 9 n=1 Tax=Liparis tanakae TaxID=230148 RepID=A0A4Z2I4V1_9TELE|nr:Solute carrier family 12 member 9 [Liparis tanakae]